MIMSNSYLRLSLLMFLQFFVWGSWYVTSGTYFLESLNFNGRQVGLIYGSSAVAALISPFIIGVIADRYFPIERILAILQFSGAILLLTLSYVQSFAVFYPLILLYMLIFLPSFSLTNSICLHQLQSPKEDFPRIRVWGTIAWITAGIIVSLLNIEDKVWPIRIAAYMSVVLGIYSLTLPLKSKTIEKSRSIKSFFAGDDLKILFQDKSFRILIVSVALICIPAAYYYSFVNPFLNDQGVSNAAGKMAVGQIFEIFAMLSLPVLFRKFKMRYIIFIGMLTWGIRYLLLAWGAINNSEFLYMLSISLHGIAYVFSILSAQIIIDIKVPDRLRSTAQGFFTFLTLGLGAFLGSYIAGETVLRFTLDNGSYDWINIWLIPGILGCLTAFYFLIRFTSFEKKKSTSS